MRGSGMQGQREANCSHKESKLMGIKGKCGLERCLGRQLPGEARGRRRTRGKREGELCFAQTLMGGW